MRFFSLISALVLVSFGQDVTASPKIEALQQELSSIRAALSIANDGTQQLLSDQSFLDRLNAIEVSLQRLTAEREEILFRLRQAEKKVQSMRDGKSEGTIARPALTQGAVSEPISDYARARLAQNALRDTISFLDQAFKENPETPHAVSWLLLRAEAWGQLGDLAQMGRDLSSAVLSARTKASYDATLLGAARLLHQHIGAEAACDMLDDAQLFVEQNETGSELSQALTTLGCRDT